MKTNEFRVMSGPSAGRARPLSRPAGRPGLKSALLGLACATGVLAVLALLYAVG